MATASLSISPAQMTLQWQRQPSTLLRGAGRASPSHFERAPASLRTVARTASCDLVAALAGTDTPYLERARPPRLFQCPGSFIRNALNKQPARADHAQLER